MNQYQSTAHKNTLELNDKFAFGKNVGKTPADLLAEFQSGNLNSLEYLLWTRENSKGSRLYGQTVEMYLDYIVHNTPKIKMRFPMTRYSNQQCLSMIEEYTLAAQLKEAQQKVKQLEEDNRMSGYNSWGTW